MRRRRARQATATAMAARTKEAVIGAVRQALRRRLRAGFEDAILRRFQSLLTRGVAMNWDDPALSDT